MHGSRAVIIGLDGADDRILRKLLDSGLCPNIGRIVNEGYYGSILSTLPPLTPPAWNSMLTGLNPGKHAIFDFIQPAEDGRFVFASTSRRKGLSLFDICLEQNAGVIDLFVPFTFPPPEDDGIHISGLGTPSSDSDFIRPHSIRDSILAEFPFLKEIDLCAGKDIHSLPVSLKDEIRMKSELCLTLMDDHDWRVSMVVFNATDLAQHYFLNNFDEAHPHYSPDETGSKVIPEIYAACDEFVGRCIERAGEGDVIAIVSDHGCQPLVSTIAKDGVLKDILQAEGLLKIRERKDDDRPSGAMQAIHKGVHALKRLTPHPVRHAFNVIFKGTKENIGKSLEAVGFGDDIDWGETKAFIGPGSYGIGVYVNLSNRYPHGTVEPGKEEEEVKDRIIEAISRLMLPDGRPLASFVARSEDVYWGESLPFAPDVLVIFNEPSSAFDGASLAEGIYLPPPGKRTGTELTWSGTHSIRGIFGLWGEGVLKGKVSETATLMDVAPTLLHMLRLKVPEGLDGKILVDADASGREPEYYQSTGDTCRIGDRLSLEEEKDIYEKLKSVGYFH